MDRFAYQPYEMRFSEQGDTWEMNCGQRTGIPLSDLKAKFDRLEVSRAPKGQRTTTVRRPSDAPAPDATLLENSKALWNGTGKNFMASMRSSFGLTQESLISKVRAQAGQYMASSPGSDQAGPNVVFHNSLKRLIRKEPLTEEQVRYC